MKNVIMASFYCLISKIWKENNAIFYVVITRGKRLVCEHFYTGLQLSIRRYFFHGVRTIGFIILPQSIITMISNYDYNKQITTRDNVNIQSDDQDKKENKLNSSIIANSGAYTLTYDIIIKSPFGKNNVATIKDK